MSLARSPPRGAGGGAGGAHGGWGSAQGDLRHVGSEVGCGADRPSRG